jgi:arginyl-tRNA synthetase
MKTYEQVDVELNEKFLSICSKLLDAILKKFNENLKYFKVKLDTMLESGPFGLGFRVQC